MRSRQIGEGLESPAAAAGGAITPVRDDDDEAVLEIPHRGLAVQASEAELANRRRVWSPPPTKVDKGRLARCAQLVTSANTGAVRQG